MDQQVINQANKLLAVNVEAETKLRNGVAHVKDDKLKNTLRKYSLLHYHYGKDIEDKIIKKNKGDSVLNDIVKEMHFASSTIGSADNINIDHNIISDCNQIEEKVLQEYEEIINNNAVKASDYALLKSHQRGIEQVKNDLTEKFNQYQLSQLFS